MNLPIIPINNIPEKVPTLAADIALLHRGPVRARKDAHPHLPRPGRNSGRANGNDERGFFFWLSYSIRICSANWWAEGSSFGLRLGV